MANSELTDLTATTTLVAADVLYVVRDTAGTPVDRKITAENLGKSLNPYVTQFKQTIRNGGGSITGLASTSWAAIDSTNLGYLTLTLAVGDVVECLFTAQHYAASSQQSIFMDFEVDQPTSGNVNVGGGGADGGLLALTNTGLRTTTTTRGNFVATEAGTHGFRPIYRLVSASPTWTFANASSGNDETVMTFSIENKRAVTA